MRIPKPVNAALDWAEQHFGAVAAVLAMVVASAAALALPLGAGLPVAGFVLGLAIGGFAVYARMSRRLARARRENDDLLRENGSLRHRNTILASGVITRESQTTQALLMIPDDEDLADEPVPDLADELLGGPATASGGAAAGALDDGSDAARDPQRTDRLPELPDGL
ncbi:hypothetical protein DZF91_32265 [Actinomadura logoneensis]|uniref:Uncharacterized protein n=1 Tax=Actinomadura logoneensis TaxID=2293572 RepID=A0A372JDT5_9ACTN|nr:hypothetical protein [Actinomadura logoneensis]RFU37558.1 hypothetical protein DZF91_32265 [Actinomadura logoneensis]